MSRSFRHQPFQSITGNPSAKRDKVMAHKGERRTYNKVLHIALKEQDFDVLLSLRSECSWNNVYCWNRDGKQRWCGLTSKDWYDYIQANDPTSWLYEWRHEHFSTWPPAWSLEMMRK